MTDLSHEPPAGTPLADIPSAVIGTAASASALVVVFAGGYLLASPSAPAWAVAGIATTVLVIAAALAITKGISNAHDN